MIARTAHVAEPPRMIKDGPTLGEASARSQSIEAPVQVLTYRLTPQDVAAWIATSQAQRRTGRAVVASSLLAGVMGLQVFSGRLPVPPAPGFALVEAAVLLVIPLALALWARRRGHLTEAAQILPEPTDIRLEVWEDRLILTEPPAAKPQVIKPRLLHRLSRTRRHILGETDTARLIVPRAAFADHVAMRAFADHLNRQRR